VEEFAKYVEPRVAFPPVLVPEFDITLAAVSFALVILSLGIASVFWLDRKELKGLKGLTDRNGAAAAGHRFLLNKYYLDHLYEGTIVAGIRGPIARAAYWVNQYVIDGVVNTAGKSSAAFGRLVYRYVDQDVVDGAVNGIANETDHAGGLMTYIQTGRVQRYALILFGSVGLLALLLVIFS
jgi:NADH-quinone oxidoreductase subunit L